MVLSLTFKSLIHFEFILVYGVRKWSTNKSNSTQEIILLARKMMGYFTGYFKLASIGTNKTLRVTLSSKYFFKYFNSKWIHFPMVSHTNAHKMYANACKIHIIFKTWKAVITYILFYNLFLSLKYIFEIILFIYLFFKCCNIQTQNWL